MKKPILCLLLFLSIPALSYEYKRGDVALRALLGNSVYFVQDQSTGIGNNIVTGFEFEYFLEPRWSVGGTFKPTFSKI